MKIVHINTTDTRGGAAQIAYTLHTQLNKIQGIESYMLVREKNSNDPSVSLFGTKGWKKWLSILTARDHTFLDGEELIKHPLIESADIIHLHNLHGYYFHLPILKKLSETKKIIWTLHDMWTMTPHCGTSLSDNPEKDGLYACRNQFEYVPILWPRQKGLAISKKGILKDLVISYVSPSNWLKEKFQKSYLGGHACTVIPNGIDTTVFYNQKKNKEIIRKELGFKKDAKIALFIANNFKDPVKGSETIAKLLKDDKLSSLEFIALGNGILPKHPRLHTIPYTKNKIHLAQYYALSDVYFHPALSDNFPTVVIESLMCGTPVVAYEVGGLKEQIRNNIDGKIIPKGDINKFIESLLLIITNTFNEEEISKHAKENFSSISMTNNYKKVYENL